MTSGGAIYRSHAVHRHAALDALRRLVRCVAMLVGFVRLHFRTVGLAWVLAQSAGNYVD